MQYNKIVLSGQAVREIEGDNTNVTNNTKNSDEVFIIEDVTNDDILNDRIKITNTGSESINDIFIYVNGKNMGLMTQKTIDPGKSEYLYLMGIYPAGKVNLKVLYKNYSQEISFDVAEDWHIVA